MKQSRPFRLRLGRRVVELSKPEAERISTLLAGVDVLGSEVTVRVRGRRHEMSARQAVRARKVLRLVMDLGGLS